GRVVVGVAVVVRRCHCFAEIDPVYRDLSPGVDVDQVTGEYILGDRHRAPPVVGPPLGCADHAAVHVGGGGGDELRRGGIHPDVRPRRVVLAASAHRADLVAVKVPGRLIGAVAGDGRRLHLPLQAGDVVVEEPAVLDDAARDLVRALGELREGDRLAAADPLHEVEVGRGEDAEV